MTPDPVRMAETWADVRSKYAVELSREAIIVRFLLQLLDAQRRFMKHGFACKALKGGGRKCTCGYDDVRKALP